MTRIFNHLILIGRPACGKSEFIDFMKKIDAKERVKEYHIGWIHELDDFVWLWEKFEEDDIWEVVTGRRLYSARSGHAYIVTNGGLLEFMFHKFNFEIEKRYLKNPSFYNDSTLFIEFSRGSVPDGGYKKALSILSRPVLERAAILYINVSFDESKRRNIARYKEKLKHSILAHKVPDEDMVRFSKTQDWHELTGARESGTLSVGGVTVPFVTMLNEPELPPGPEIGKRYKKALDKLFELFTSPACYPRNAS